MRPRLTIQDTISRRLIVTVALAAGVTLLLLELFTHFGGQWTKPDIEATGMVREVASVIRMTGVTPSGHRQALLEAANTHELHFAWYAQGSPLAMALERGRYRSAEIDESWHFLSPHLTHRPSRMAVFQEDNPVSTLPGLPYDRSVFHDAYFAGVRLDDGSWVLCIALQRFWGLYALQRLTIEGALLVLWIVAVSLIASRQLSRPIAHLAEGVRQSAGERALANPALAHIPETGPREIRLVAQTINALQAQIAKFVTDRTTMLAAISHDLRTPLTRIRLRGEFIDCALSFFRDDTSREESTAFDLSGLLQTIVYEYADQGHDVRYDNPGRVAYRGPVHALKRVFANLVENAIKYATPPHITLTRSAASSGDERCSPADALIVTILDEGPGIPENALAAVFEPYFRLDKSRNRKTGGVGLGLTSARSIMRAHGGDVCLTNRPQGGLCVRVLLPADR